MMRLSKTEQMTLAILGHRYADKPKSEAKEFTIPERPVNETFLSMNGSPEDFAFRGIKSEDE